MDNKDLQNISKVFNIRDIREEYYEEPVYSHIDFNEPYSTVYTNRSVYYNIKVNEIFMYMLADYIKFAEDNSIYDPTHPQNLYNFFVKIRESYEKDIKEQYLQHKYPELKEIQKEYEVTKALVVDKNDM